MTRKLLQRQQPFALPEMEVADMAAIKTISKGEATPEQQVRAWEFIIKKLCQVGSLSFNADDQFVTSFNEGKRMVGLQIIYITETPIDKLKKEKIN